jgi:indolepyruvate decarboxylase
LLNAGRYGWNPLVIVFNNSSWEMLRTFQPESGFNDLPELNYARIANELGGRGYRASTREQFKDALATAAHNTDSFQLVEVMINRGVLSNTLGRFVEGIGKMRQQADGDI